MARQWRIEYPGALYHVSSQGNGRQDIFLSDQDRRYFLDLLEECCARFNIEVHAYVLMGNHYHLLLKTHDANLSKAMHWFITSYTRRFNLLNKKTGHLFQGRFKSIIVENDAYLLRLSCYIHRNPLRAGIIERLADYPWSSYRYYAYKQKAPDWLTTDLVLNQINGSDRNRVYRQKVQQYVDEKRSIWEDVAHGIAFGSSGFLKELKTRFLYEQKEVEFPQRNKLFRDVDLHTVCDEISRALEIDSTYLRPSRKISTDQRLRRDLVIYLLWESGRFTNGQIGDLLGMTYSNVSRRAGEIRQRIGKESALQDKIQQIKSEIII
jgi:putative transposase